jgi:hypothetical protein
MNGLLKTLKGLWGMVEDNSTTILTVGAVTGVVSTFVLAITATPKAMGLIDDAIWNKYEERENGSALSFEEWLGTDRTTYTWKDRANILTKKELLGTTWKTYIPAAAAGLITIGCIIGSNYISSQRNAVLVGLYSLTETAFKEYKSKVVETIGANKEVVIRDEISGDKIRANPHGANEVVFVGNGKTLCYDSLSGRYFRSDIEAIRRSVNELNKQLINEDFITLNEFYDAIGLANTTLGAELGWDMGKGFLELTFSAQLTEDNEPCLVLNYNAVPKFMR